MKKAFWFIVCALMGMFYACDEGTGSLGMEGVPESDKLAINTKNFRVTSRSIAVDSVLARTSSCYLGSYTDEETGSNIQSDFIVQFNCTENYSLPDTIMGDSAYSTELCMYFDEFIGDSLAPCRVSLYPLTKTLDNSKLYFTNIDPKEYYDESAGPIATKTFTISDRQLSDSARASGYYHNIRMKLPTSIGTDLLRKYKENPKYFANAQAFQENVNKGYYVKFERGESVMMKIYVTQFNTYYNYFTDSRVGVRDSLIQGSASFSATEEVIQANKIVNSDIEPLLKDTQASYLKTPSGIFTELTLPIEEISTYNDTINSAKLIIPAYNSAVDKERMLPNPTYILMVKKSEANDFFAKYKTPDNNTSYYSTYGADYNNTYTFNNICHLVTSIRNEMTKGLATDPNWKENNPDWNKVLLIPVSITFDS
ncbi:MAG: DUF4270 domain-containing protein, partial [Bacteroidaceae bacterium]|nr:DUF4270 domain-containing protein [Bacteroidaceae bacterium]